MQDNNIVAATKYSTFTDEREKPTGNRCLFFILIITNTIIGIIGIAILVLSIMSWVKTKQADTFILSLFVLALFMILVTCIGYFCVKHSKTMLIVYIIIYTLITLGVITISVVIGVDKQVIIDNIISKMTESQEIIQQIEEFLETNFQNICIAFICLSVVLVKYNKLIHIYL